MSSKPWWIKIFCCSRKVEKIGGFPALNKFSAFFFILRTGTLLNFDISTCKKRFANVGEPFCSLFGTMRVFILREGFCPFLVKEMRYSFFPAVTEKIGGPKLLF